MVGSANFSRVLVLGAVAASAVASAYLFEVLEKPSLSVALGLGLPVIVTALPLLAPSGGLAVALRAFAAFILLAGSVFFFAYFYLPAATLLFAAVIAELDMEPATMPPGGKD